jgi:hypothetical protein
VWSAEGWKSRVRVRSEPGGVVVQTEGGDPEPVDVMWRGRDVGPWTPLGWDCHFLPSAQARPGGDGASQVSLIRLISVCLSGQESSHHILNFFAKRNILLTKNF